MTPFRDLAHAEEYAARVHARINGLFPSDLTAGLVRIVSGGPDLIAADRRRVDRDLAGLRDHNPMECGACWRSHVTDDPPCPDARRYAEGLVETGALYGVTP